MKKMCFAFCFLPFIFCKSADVITPTVVTLPILSIENVTLLEGNSKTIFPFKVSLSKATDKEVTVQFATKDNTAIGGKDYVSKSGVLTIPANTTQGVIEITVIGDTIKQDDKLFNVLLSSPTNATLANVSALGTIQNDDTFDGYQTPETYTGYSKLWNDEFNGTAIDRSIWKFETGGNGWGNNELEYYTDKDVNPNAFISNGNLIIEARQESYNGKNYTSARMTTQGNKEFAFGRVDMRAKIPKGKGIWPALWMLGKNITTNGWPNCGEIDIMETIGSLPKDLHATVHYGLIGASNSTSKTAVYSAPTGDLSDFFHVYSLVWTQDTMEIMIDNISYLKTNKTAIGNVYPFNDPFFVIFNVAVGGNWPGTPDGSTIFPARMAVDYIRVFKKN